MTLREVFSSIANAIRSKTGKTETIKPVDMATEIESIQTGGGDNKLSQLVDGSITTVTAEDLAGATQIRNYAFQNCKALILITLPNNVTFIGDNAFQNCQALTSITIPDNVTKIGLDAFSGCSSLISITLPNSITRIGSNTFQNCQALTSITIPDNVTKIGNYAFSGCSSLTQITIPANITSIGGSALQIGSSTNKATITMKPITPPTITTSTFISSNLNKIIVPVGCGDTYKSATNWSKFADYIEEATA